MRNLTKGVGLGLATIALFLAPAALADINVGGSGAPGTGQTVVPLANPLGNCQDLSCPAAAVANFLFTIAIPICGILILWGGFQMMTAAGNAEKISQGKKTILWTVIGFAIVLIAGSVAKLIQSFFGGGT